jgi:hypothetical protein
MAYIYGIYIYIYGIYVYVYIYGISYIYMGYHGMIWVKQHGFWVFFSPASQFSTALSWRPAWNG